MYTVNVKSLQRQQRRAVGQHTPGPKARAKGDARRPRAPTPAGLRMPMVNVNPWAMPLGAMAAAMLFGRRRGRG